MEFLRNMVCDLGAEPSFRKAENIHRIQQEITRLSRERRTTPVFILDEANHLDGTILNDLKILFNFEMDSKDPAVVLLSGLPGVARSLRLSSHEDLRQRLVMNYHMDGLSKEEARGYIERKLGAAGCTRNVFSPGALEAVLNSAAGLPRVINRLCTRAMMFGASADEETVSAETAVKAASDIEI